jgi:hypothetical protein
LVSCFESSSSLPRNSLSASFAESAPIWAASAVTLEASDFCAAATPSSRADSGLRSVPADGAPPGEGPAGRAEGPRAAAPLERASRASRRARTGRRSTGSGGVGVSRFSSASIRAARTAAAGCCSSRASLASSAPIAAKFTFWFADLGNNAGSERWMDPGFSQIQPPPTPRSRTRTPTTRGQIRERRAGSGGVGASPVWISSVRISSAPECSVPERTVQES